MTMVNPGKALPISILCLLVTLIFSAVVNPPWKLIAVSRAPGPCDLPNGAARQLLGSSFCKTPVSDIVTIAFPRWQVDRKSQITMLLYVGVPLVGIYFLLGQRKYHNGR